MLVHFGIICAKQYSPNLSDRPTSTSNFISGFQITNFNVLTLQHDHQNCGYIFETVMAVTGCVLSLSDNIVVLRKSPAFIIFTCNTVFQRKCWYDSGCNNNKLCLDLWSLKPVLMFVVLILRCFIMI